MFQDKADPLFDLRRGLAEDENADELAGGGGGPVSDQDSSSDEGQEAGAASDAGAEPVQQSEDAAEPASTEETAPAEEGAGGAEAPQAASDQEGAGTDEGDISMEDKLAFEKAMEEGPFPDSSSQPDYSGTFQQLREGDVVVGTVVHIDREGVLVDVGTKSEGIIRLGELTRQNIQNPEEVVSVGEKISVYVMKPETSEGNLLLSKKRADFEKAWDRVAAANQEDKTLTAMVTDRVKGGLVVDLGIRGFVPASHVGSGRVKNLEKYVGQSIPLKVIEVDRERKKVVLSHRLAVEEERDKKREETLATLEEGQTRGGIVRRITDYGAFVDLGGIDGLLHISEMSWTRINHPSEVVKVGQKVQVMVLKMNLEQGRVSLGMRQILPDPWQNLGDSYRVGQIIAGKISRLVPFGAFIQLDEGVEAIIPNQELALRRIKKPEQVVSVGDDVEARILDLRPEERRMTLSVRAVLQEREVDAQSLREVHTHQPHVTREAPKTTVADLLGDAFTARREEFEREMQRETKAKSRARKKAKDKAKERDETDAFGDLSDDELLDLAVTDEYEVEGQEGGPAAVVVAEGSEPEDVAEAEDVAGDAEASEEPEAAAAEEDVVAEGSEPAEASEAAEAPEATEAAEDSEAPEADAAPEVEPAPEAESDEPAGEEPGEAAESTEEEV